MRNRVFFLLITILLSSACSNIGDFDINDRPYSADGEKDASRAPRTILATVKQDADGSAYLWSKGVRINPSEPIVFERQHRVMTQLSYIDKGDRPVWAHIHWMEPIDEGVFTNNASVAGSDGLDVNEYSWMSGTDDGYLTLFYTTWWGEHPVHHDFYLVSGLDPDDPYSLELRHNAHGDKKQTQGDGLICFDINSLPDTGDESKIISLKWHNTEGKTITAKFEFRSRK